MVDLPPKPEGSPLPRYDPFASRPPKLSWRRGKKLPDWLSNGPELTEAEQYVSWSDPVWLWYEGRDGLFLLSSSFLVVDQGYWDRVWHERGGLYLYLATHCYVQLHGPSALSLAPRGEIDALVQVDDAANWRGAHGTIFSGLHERPDCYVAPRALPWRSGVGSILVVYGDSKGERPRALKRLHKLAGDVYKEHRSVLAARQTFRRHLWVAEHRPCEVVRREFGWWNTSMQATFHAEAPAAFGQVELAPLEPWQLFDVDRSTGAWRKR